MEKVLASKGENRRVGSVFSNIRLCCMEDVEEKEAEKKITMSWRRYERRKAREHRGKHVGGAGKEDYRRGDVKGEVKHMKRPMAKPELMRTRKKGITEIEALGDFTEPAKKYARRRKMKLFHRGKRVV